MRFFNPASISAPASNYSQGVVVPANAERLIIAGQIGANPDGSLAEGLEAQMERAWLNMFAILEDAGMTKKNLVKVTVFKVGHDLTARYRETRDRMLDGRGDLSGGEGAGQPRNALRSRGRGGCLVNQQAPH